MATSVAVQHVDFTLKGWTDDPKDERALAQVTIRGALEYAEDVVVTDEGVKAFALDMVRRYRDDLPAAFWDQPLEFEWEVETETRGDYGNAD